MSSTGELEDIAVTQEYLLDVDKRGSKHVRESNSVHGKSNFSSVS